jgi:hypothetical protein
MIRELLISSNTLDTVLAWQQQTGKKEYCLREVVSETRARGWGSRRANRQPLPPDQPGRGHRRVRRAGRGSGLRGAAVVVRDTPAGRPSAWRPTGPHPLAWQREKARPFRQMPPEVSAAAVRSRFAPLSAFYGCQHEAEHDEDHAAQRHGGDAFAEDKDAEQSRRQRFGEGERGRRGDGDLGEPAREQDVG